MPSFQYHWMYSATAYNHAYNDSGIFCIHASSHPQSLVELTQVKAFTEKHLLLLASIYHAAIVGIGSGVGCDNR